MELVKKIKKFLLVLAITLPMTHWADSQLPDRNTFYVTPVVEGLAICLAAQNSEKVRNTVSLTSWCGKYKFDTSALLTNILNALEAGGPSGKVQVGYTLTIPLLDLYTKKGNNWSINTTKVNAYLTLVAKVNRPVVIYLAANHFDTSGPLSIELAKDKRNMMLTANGTPPDSSYFGYPIAPFTLLTDNSIPVNHYRFEALKHISQKITRLPPAVHKRIIAVTLAGELHHMFDDFENGMGVFEKTGVTDYSPESIAQFKSWLFKKYGTIKAFNKATGFDFSNFDTVAIPAKNIRTDRLASFAEHYDGFAHGFLPVSGWLWDAQGQIEKLELYVDGRGVSQIPRGFNRLDVYRAVEEIKTANVGFRFDFGFEQLTVGRHVGQVIAHAGKKRYEVAQFEFNVMPRDQAKPPNRSVPILKSLDKLEKLKGIKAWLDIPRQQQDVYFNPLARDWNAYRESQVMALMSTFHTIAKNNGIPETLLYSHQILPQLNSSWNEQLFAVGSTFGGNTPWKNGLNMYGGAVNSEWLHNFITEHQIQDYGVPEFNPQQWKQTGLHLQAMQAQYKSGARFISPYFISVTSDQSSARSAVTKMELRPDNKAEGSDLFYQAIREFAAH